MEKKLFRVKVILYVMAENESDACVAATNAQFDIFECSARKAEHVDPGWEEAVPYNSTDDRTCAEVFASQQQVIHKSIPLPAIMDSGRANVRPFTAAPYLRS
ncbi:MAG TPA: hypothetical protein VMC09_16925 [Anaerolineales bacterium]|nr:hypothetical protein [Anaerolineales bacterium]